MKEWIQSQIASGLSAFPGLTLSGQVPVREELVNELLAAWLRDAATSPQQRPPKDTTAQLPDFTSLMQTVRRVSVHAGPGVITLDFEVKV